MDIYIGKKIKYIDSFGYVQNGEILYIEDKKFLVSANKCGMAQYDDSIRELNIKDKDKLFWEIE